MNKASLVSRVISMAEELQLKTDSLAGNESVRRLAGIHLARILKTPAWDFYGWANGKVLTRMLEEIPQEGRFKELWDSLSELATC